MFLTSLRSLASGQTRRDHLVEGNGVEDQVVAQCVQIQRLFVERPLRPASSDIMSSFAVSGFIATRKSISFLRAM